MSSDDSIDIPTICGSSNGVALRLMEQMGYVPGHGLGAHGQGRIEPIEVARRTAKLGLRDPNEDEEEIIEDTRDKNEVDELQVILNALYLDLDVQWFYSQFSTLSVWDELDLWQAIYAAVAHRIRTCPKAELTEMSHDLIVAQSALPRSYYMRLLDLWLSRMDLPDLLLFASSHVTLVAPMQPQITSRVMQHLDVVLKSSQLLGIAMQLAPQLRREIDTYILNASVEELAVYLLTTKNYAIPLRGTLVEQYATATELQNALNKAGFDGDTIRTELLDNSVLPVWFHRLENDLKNGHLPLNLERDLATICDKRWALAVSNAVNIFLDLGAYPNPKLYTFEIAMQQFCDKHGYKHHANQSTAEGGILVGPTGRKLQWCVVDDTLHVVSGVTRTPVRLNHIHALLT